MSDAVKAELIAAVGALVQTETYTQEEIDRIDDLLDLCEEHGVESEVAWTLYEKRFKAVVGEQ